MKTSYYSFISSRSLPLVLFLISSSVSLTFCTNDHLTDLAKKVNAALPDTVSTKSNNNNSTTNTGSTTSTVAAPGTTTTTTPTNGTSTGGTVSFAITIKPILAKYQCANCHGSYYESYAGVSSLAKSGQLYGMMSWSSGYRRMPPGEKATSAELTLISNWIKEGALNN